MRCGARIGWGAGPAAAASRFSLPQLSLILTLGLQLRRRHAGRW